MVLRLPPRELIILYHCMLVTQMIGSSLMSLMPVHKVQQLSNAPPFWLAYSLREIDKCDTRQHLELLTKYSVTTGIIIASKIIIRVSQEFRIRLKSSPYSSPLYRLKVPPCPQTFYQVPEAKRRRFIHEALTNHESEKTDGFSIILQKERLHHILY
jgi:hypothetical protein